MCKTCQRNLCEQCGMDEVATSATGRLERLCLTCLRAQWAALASIVGMAF